MNGKKQIESTLTIDERICRADLTKSEKKVLDFIMVHKEETCYYSSQELADVVHVSGSTVVRVAYKLGFERFSLFKKALQKEARRQHNDNAIVQPSLIRLEDIWNKSDREILNEYNAIQIQNLTESFRRNGVDRYIRIAEQILTARRVYLIGYRMASGAVDFFQRLLKLSRDNVVCVTSIDMMTEEMYGINEEDCAVIICLPRISTNILATLEVVEQHRAKLIAITDKMTNLIAAKADHVLVADRTGASYSNSYLGVWANIELLLSVISKKSYSETAARLELREKYLEKNRQY